MKVKVFVTKTIDCEIDDKFRPLSICPTPPELLDGEWCKLHQDCIKTIKKITGLRLWSYDLLNREEAESDLANSGLITAVRSIENDVDMVEA